MKKIILTLLLLPTLSLASISSVFDNGHWYAENSELTTHAHKPFKLQGKTYDHSLEFTTPYGESSKSDACELVNPFHMVCYTMDDVLYNPGNHSVLLNSWGEEITYIQK